MSLKAQEERNAVVRKKMLDLRDIVIGPMPSDSPWLRPVRFSFLQDGQRRYWDIARGHESVSIVTFNTTRKTLIFVRQFRAGAYYAALPEEQGPVDVHNHPAETGLTLELCSGIVDKDIPLNEIARDELREECGYEAPASTFEKIITYGNSARTAARNTLFYVEVTDDMHLHPGGGAESEGELIEVVEMSIPEVREYIKLDEVRSPSGLLFGVYWFLANKPQHCS